MSVSFVAGQLPPVFFICLIISSLWLRSFLHFNIKWSTVCSSSSQGHIRSSVSPSLYKYDFMLPCPVSKVVNSGNTNGLFEFLNSHDMPPEHTVFQEPPHRKISGTVRSGDRAGQAMSPKLRTQVTRCWTLQRSIANGHMK